MSSVLVLLYTTSACVCVCVSLSISVRSLVCVCVVQTAVWSRLSPTNPPSVVNKSWRMIDDGASLPHEARFCLCVWHPGHGAARRSCILSHIWWNPTTHYQRSHPIKITLGKIALELSHSAVSGSCGNSLIIKSTFDQLEDNQGFDICPWTDVFGSYSSFFSLNAALGTMWGLWCWCFVLDKRKTGPHTHIQKHCFLPFAFKEQ